MRLGKALAVGFAEETAKEDAVTAPAVEEAPAEPEAAEVPVPAVLAGR